MAREYTSITSDSFILCKDKVSELSLEFRSPASKLIRMCQDLFSNSMVIGSQLTNIMRLSFTDKISRKDSEILDMIHDICEWSIDVVICNTILPFVQDYKSIKVDSPEGTMVHHGYGISNRTQPFKISEIPTTRYRV